MDGIDQQGPPLNPAIPRDADVEPQPPQHGEPSPNTAPVLVKLYDLLLWYTPVIARFRRDARYTLGERLEETLLDAHARLTDAVYGHERRQALLDAGRCIDRARLLSRLAHDLGVLDHRRYLHASERLVEVGRMIGGWRRARAGSGARVSP